MANVIPLFKKENKQFKTNYRPVSLSVSLIYQKFAKNLFLIGFMNFLRSPFFSIVFNRAFDPVIQKFPSWYILSIKYTKLLKKVMNYVLCS